MHESMSRFTVSLFALLIIATPGAAAAQTCFPVKSEVVSLGQENAEVYTGRSLDRAIAARTEMIEASGREVGNVTREDLECAPYPNLIGADEWRCAGRAVVCAAN